MNKQVKIDVYNYFKLVDSFFVEYKADSVLKYVEYVDNRKYYPYDTIDIDNGKMIIIPIVKDMAFVITLGQYFIVDEDETINLLRPEDDGRD